LHCSEEIARLIEFCQGPDPHPRRPRWTPPPAAIDTHFHIFGPAERYPYVSDREYTPPDALPAACRHLFQTLGIGRAVLVQPSVYGADNRCAMDSAAELGVPARIIVVVPYETPDTELRRLHEGGARGVRFIIAHAGGLPLADLERFSTRVKDMGWHIQLLLRSNDLVALEPRLAKLPSDIVIDHMGFIRPADGGVEQPAFQALLRLLQRGHCWVKFSGAYRLSVDTPAYRDLAPFARALVEVRPDRLLWGSDWPHAVFKGRMPNTTDLFDLLIDWVPDEKTRARILVENPATLFGF
jgi:predicted TIM-barrel fold metal-dependent hydrolase